MTYEVPLSVLESRFLNWKRAMLIDVSNSLNIDFDNIDPETYEIDSVAKYYLLISAMNGLLFTRFRGEAKYYQNPCLPIIARNPAQLYDTRYEIAEIERFKESELAKPFLEDFPKYETTWWMLTQHFPGFKTRLLDITRNPLIGLFFACEKYPDEDGVVYVIHSTNKTSIPISDDYTGYEQQIKDMDNRYPDNTFVYLRPYISVDRLNRQEAEFLWVKNYDDLRNKGLYNTGQIIPIIIRAEHKKKIMNELKDPHGIDWEFLNPKNNKSS